MVKVLSRRDEIKKFVYSLGFTEGHANSVLLWILAAMECDSLDPETVRNFMGYKIWFDYSLTLLKRHGYLTRGKLRLPEEIFKGDEAGTVALVLLGLEINGLVRRIPDAADLHIPKHEKGKNL